MTIEDCIEFLAQNIDIRASDIKLIKSFANQCKKNIALTDRQHELAKQKIIDYKEELNLNGFENVEDSLNNLRNPYRIIDRSKTIKLVSKSYADFFETTTITMLAIRFPFSKKMIKHIELISKLQDRKEFDRNTKTHFLNFTEKNVLAIIDALKDSNFDIQPEILDYYNKVKLFVTDEKKHLPGIYNYKLKNVHQRTVDFIVDKLGKPCLENLSLYFDRRDSLGLNYFDIDDLNLSLQLKSSLAKKIAYADTKNVFLDMTAHTFQEIFLALSQLQKFPLLIILKKKDQHTTLQKIFEHLKLYTDPKNIAVLFRLENNSEENILFNQLVKKLNLNNQISKETQVVFLDNGKIPKPLFNSNWLQSTTLLLESFRQSKLVTHFHNKADLVIHYDLQPSTWTNQKLTIL
jgi:hypothetical protein